jgi:hypothetical protein
MKTEHLSIRELREFTESYQSQPVRSLDAILNNTAVLAQEEINRRYKKYSEFTEDVKADMKKLAKDWSKADGDAADQALIKKYKLQPIVSRLRGGIKLGVTNDLKLNPKKIVAGLDENGDLIFVTGNPPKVFSVDKFLKEDADYTEAKSGDKEAYEKFFQSALKKFGAKSPADLDDKKKKEFFDYVDKNWKADDEKTEECDKDEKYTEAFIDFTSPASKAAYIKKHDLTKDKDFSIVNTTRISVSKEFVDKNDPASDKLVDFVKESDEFTEAKGITVRELRRKLFESDDSKADKLRRTLFELESQDGPADKKHIKEAEKILKMKVESVQEESDLSALRLFAKVKLYREDIDLDSFTEFLEDYDGELETKVILERYVRPWSNPVLPIGSINVKNGKNKIFDLNTEDDMTIEVWKETYPKKDQIRYVLTSGKKPIYKKGDFKYFRHDQTGRDIFEGEMQDSVLAIDYKQLSKYGNSTGYVYK